MRMHRRVGSTIVILSVAAVAVLAPSHSAIHKASNGNMAPGSAGMMAYLDPESGEVVVGHAVAGDVQLDPETQNALRRDTEGLEVVRHADGSESIDLQGRYQNVSIITIDENGKATICTDNPVAAEKALNDTPVSTTPEVK